jgi:hypothetical protein
MRGVERGIVLFSCAVALAACGARPGSAGASGDRNSIEVTADDATRHPNAFVLIRALRPHWLETRGPASIAVGASKRVYLDDMFLGELNVLRQITSTSIVVIIYLDGPAATQRWGTDHAAGVIQIVSKRP